MSIRHAQMGVRRAGHISEDGDQPGDPAKAAQAIITAVRILDTPLMRVLGPEAIEWFRKAMNDLNADIEAWEKTSLSTDFAG